MSVYDDYKDRLAGLPEQDFIGQIVWYSINTGNISLDEVEKQFMLLNIPVKFLPKPIAAIDAFRKATNLEQGNKVEYPAPWAGEGHSARVLIREVTKDAKMVERHIIRENVDAKGRALSYEKIGEAVFERAPRQGSGKQRGYVSTGERVRFNLLSPMVHPDEVDVLTGMVTDVQNRYKHYCVNLDGNAIRKIVREYVSDLNAISVKPSGGVYFVHKEKWHRLDAIQKFVYSLNTGSTFHALPLVDTEEQRGMLSEAFQTEVETDVQELLRDIGDLNEAYKNKAGIPSDKYDAVLDRYTTLITRSEEYTTVLGASQARAATAIEMALMACMELAGRVEIKETK
jgi:hypothetical protein